MVDAAIQLRPLPRWPSRKPLAYALWGAVGLHCALLLALGQRAAAASRLVMAVIPLLAAVCTEWRAQRLAERERTGWRWLSLALVLWAGGQLLEALLGGPPTASSLTVVDAADLFYIAAAFPVFLAVTGSRDQEKIRASFYLNSAQIGLALSLAFFRLYRMPMSAAQAAKAMMAVAAGECLLLAFAAVLRLASWSTLEERRRTRLVCVALWLYLSIELWMSYASWQWHLRAGTLLDILWGVPFLFSGWQALRLPVDTMPTEIALRRNRLRLLFQNFGPLLVSAGIFLLAVSIAREHPLIALSAIFLLLLIQGVQGGLVQMSYRSGREMLLSRERELEIANLALERLALEDPLTGIANRRHFNSALDESWKRAARQQQPVTILMIDLDYFKAINDAHGHPHGDQCLLKVAQVLSEFAGRAGDLLARYGGEEFVLLLPNTSLGGAMTVAERMRYAIYSQKVANGASPFDKCLTISIGIGACDPKPGAEPGALLRAADQALYEAKGLGRNRICARAR